MEISVIIPTYNVEEYIEESLNSIINQTFKDIEIICINDGSQDNTLNILKEYETKDSRIKVINQENNGPSSARNKGLEAAKGEYILFLDSDDFIDSNALTELYDIAKEKNTDLIIFKSKNFINDPNEPFEEQYNEMEQIPARFKNELFSFEDLLEDFSRIDVTVSTKFFKHDLIKNVRFDEDVIFEDNLFTMDYIFRANRIYFYDKVLHHRRLRPNSIITDKNNRKHVDGITVNNRMVEKVKQAGYYDDVKEQLFIKNFTKISYRFIDIADEHKEYFYNCIKEDMDKNAEQIKKDLDFSLIDERTAFTFDSMLNTNYFWELELKVRCYDYEFKINELNEINEKLLEENKKLKNDLEKCSE